MSADTFDARVRAFIDGLQELTARTGLVAGFTTGHCSCCNNDGSEDGIQLSEAEGPGEYVGDDSRLAWMSTREAEKQRKREARAEKRRRRRAEEKSRMSIASDCLEQAHGVGVKEDGFTFPVDVVLTSDGWRECQYGHWVAYDGPRFASEAEAQIEAERRNASGHLPV